MEPGCLRTLCFAAAPQRWAWRGRTGGVLWRDRHLGTLRGKAGHPHTKTVEGVWRADGAATPEGPLGRKGMRLERLPVTDGWHARLRRLGQQPWVARSQGRCQLDLGLAEMNAVAVMEGPEEAGVELRNSARKSSA